MDYAGASKSYLANQDLLNTILAISREFISSKPYDEVLQRVCRRIAGFVRCYAGPDLDIWYVFPNAQPPETKLFRFGPSADPGQGLFDGGPWKSAWNEDCHQFSNDEVDALCNVIKPSFEEGGRAAALEYIKTQQKYGYTFAALSLSRLAKPMGHILLPANWASIDQQRLIWHLHTLQCKTFDYFEAYYQATARTYLPSFYQRRTKPVSILFCDLRNSTTVFQVLRIGGEAHIRRFLAFLKAFMRLAAEYIVSSGLGTMYTFTGDGFMATFGDHVIPKNGVNELHARGAGGLGLFVAERLQRGFVHLYRIWRTKGLLPFDLEYNEDVGVRLGVGLGYGNVHFDEFGISRTEANAGGMSRGLLYYNAVGDHMNVAARLCGIAHAELSTVDVVDRPSFDSSSSYGAFVDALDCPSLNYLAPIVITKPMALALWQTQGLLPQPSFTTVRLKGVGNRIPILEIWPKSLDLRLRPEEAARSSRFPPENVAHLMKEVTDDDFYAEQVNVIGYSETEIVNRLIESLSSELEEID
jgi:class 3 adenylate cyclase